jgi:hypothetical protein
MKLLTISLFTFFVSASAYAADFPTGTFSCGNSSEQPTPVTTVKISDTGVGGVSLPLIEVSSADTKLKARGIAAVIVSASGGNLFLGLYSFSWSPNDPTTLGSSHFGTCQSH